MNRTGRNVAIAALICALLLTMLPGASAASSLVEADRIGIGGGGSFCLPLIDPTDSSHYMAATDMGGFYYSMDSGFEWGRNETSRVYTACVADDGTVFTGGYGLRASTDGGETLTLIYPRQEDVKYAINRLGRVDGIMEAEGYDGGFVVGVDTYEDQVYFLSIEWSAQHKMRLGRCGFDGSNLEILYDQPQSSSPMQGEFKLVAEEDRVLMARGGSVLCFDLTTGQMSAIYTAQGTIQDFGRIGDQYYILDETGNETLILHTPDFVTYENLNDLNTLPTTFMRGGVERSFTWHYDEICGNDGEHIFLGFHSPVPGSSTIGGILYFDGESFRWVYDNVFNPAGADTQLGWNFGSSIYPIYGMCADPNDSNHCLVTNTCTVFDVYFDDSGSRSITALHCQTNSDGTYNGSGLDCQTTYFVREDPFDPEHIAICSTDFGLQLSWDGGESFRLMKITWEKVTNTCYDLYFDPNTPDLVYGLWSSRHDAPYTPALSDVNAVGSFSVSRDGGITWEHFYGQGLPENSIPVKMSVVPNGEELTIAVATFNNGFYLSHDSGKTFTSISKGMETYADMIWGSDVAIAGDEIYCLTASHTLSGSRTPSALYCYNMATGQLRRIDLGEDLVIARAMTYEEGQGLFVCAIPQYRAGYVPALGRNHWVNYGGGVYRIVEDRAELEYEVYDGAFDCGFTSDGTMYISGALGQVYMARDGECRLYVDGLFPALKTVSFSADERTLYVATSGGGTYRIPTAALPDTGAAPKTHTVSFLDYDGTLLDQQTVRNGEAASTAVIPQRAADEAYHYTFLDWDTDTGAVYEDLTVTALYEAALHEPLTCGAEDAGCTAQGYTGDVYCSVCDLLLEEGETIPAAGHTAGAAQSLGNELHAIACARCGELLTRESCADADSDGSCDACGAEVYRGMRFVKADSFTEGRKYMLVSNGCTVGRSLQAVAVTMTPENGMYTPSFEPVEQQLWNYTGGKLYTTYNNRAYYLYVIPGSYNLTVTCTAGYGNVWSYENGILCTTVTNIFYRYKCSLYLKQGCIMSARALGSQFEIYELVP